MATTGHENEFITVDGLKSALLAYKTNISDTKLNSSLKGANNGLAELDSNGKVPTAQLPSFVDDVIEGYLYNDKFYKESAHTTEITGEGGKIYTDLSTNKTYRWGGSSYTQIKGDLVIGTASGNAADGATANTHYNNTTVHITAAERTAWNGKVGNVAYDTTNKKLTKTVGSTTSDIVTAAKIVTDGGALTAHQSVTDNNPTLAWSTKSKVATIGSTEINVTMPANPNTDTKVTSVSNHYAPSADSSSALSASATGATAAWGIDVVKGVTLSRDAKGHVTAVSVTSGKIPSNPNTDRYVNSAAFADDTSNDASNPVKMTLTRAGSDSVAVTASLPKVSSSSAGVVPKGAAVSSQSTSTKFLREDGSWAAPSYPDISGKADKSSTVSTISYGSKKITKTINGTTSDVVSASTIVTDGGGLKSHQTIKQDGVTGATCNRFGTCSTAAETGAKTVSITSGTFSLEAGARVTVDFANVNTAFLPTLNVNSTGAKSIKTYDGGAPGDDYTNPNILQGVHDLVYDGTDWIIQDIITSTEKAKLEGITAGATKVEASSTNGKIKINGTDTTVYTHPSGTNPHGTTKSDVGLGNVGNFKAVSTVASQGLTDTEKSNARANIGAGTSSFSGSYTDLTNKPTIPTVNNATFSVKTKVGSNSAVTVADFTANQSAADDVTLIQGSNITLTSDTTNRTVTIAASIGQGTVAKLGSTTKPVYTSAAGTFAECSTYAGGTAVTLNGTSKAASTATIYAPTSAGTAGQILVSAGSGAPSWTSAASTSVCEGIVSELS